MTQATVPNARPIAELLSNLTLGPRQAYKALSVWPLLQRGQPAASLPPFALLADALEGGWLDVDEVSEGGSVPNVRVTNRGSRPVLLLFGEEIVGAKQNRIANASFLVSAKGSVVIDVSCVEAGRWSRPAGAGFRASDHVVSQSLRKRVSTDVESCRERTGRYHSDQADVWSEVSARLGRSGARSDTAAYSDYVRKIRRAREEIDRAFHPVPGQVGFVAGLGDGIEGVEIVGDAEAFERVFQRLLRAYTTDAVDLATVREAGSQLDPPRFDGPEPFLRAVARARTEARPSLGEGVDLRLCGGGVAGSALVSGGVLHLMAFPREETGGA